ncbi:MAG: hypothetical protein VX911_00410 [Candidatus Latescibacterota bacterium]|nr:hypothetical protein [Candidatus Latescibacterota bacterium]
MLKFLALVGVVYLCVRLYRSLGESISARKGKSNLDGTADKSRAVDAEFEEI